MTNFFIGYNWPQPPGLLRAVKYAALGLGVGVVGLSGALALGHVPVDGGLFEFGQVQTFTGTVVATPHPMLRPDVDDGAPWPLLVEKGKHGAEETVANLDGRRVALQATRIARGEHTMLEIADSSVTIQGSSRAATVANGPGARVTLRGEIVDSKCFLGVMVPGSGTTHRDCASLCLRGGIPPALHVQQPDGTRSLLLLLGPQPLLRERAAALAGDTVEIVGTIGQQAGWTTVESDPADWRRAGQ